LEVLKLSKILFVATVASHIKAFHLPYINMLQRQGHEVEVACSTDVSLNEFRNVWSIPFSRSPYSLNNIKAYLIMRKLLKNRGYDLIHTHTPVASFITRFAARNLGVPVLYTAHGFHFYKGAPLRYWILYYNAERLSAKWTAGLVVMNREDFEAGQKLGFIEGKNLYYVHGVGVDINKYQQRNYNVREKLGLSDKANVVVCVAEFVPNKNHIQLIKAWKYVCDREPDSVLLLVGKGKILDKIRRAVLNLDITKNVYFLGYRNDVPQILSASNIFVLCSYREGLPRAVMEAMAVGKPVVATNVRGNCDLVEDGVNGYLVHLGNPYSLADAILKLVRNPELAQQFGKAGRKKIEDYSLQNVINEMDNIYTNF
jgi:glycosyltransferase involved in cell wall biosynthesis